MIRKIFIFLFYLILFFTLVGCSENHKDPIIKITGITLKDGSFDYNGASHSLSINGILPSGVTVTYTGNEKIDAGVYTVTATFTDNTGKYEVPSPMTATLTILQRISIIKYDVNGGDELITQTQEVIYDDYCSLQIPTRIGYNFDGWYNGDDIVADGLWKYSKDITLKAKWSAITYNIIYNTNGGETLNNQKVTFNSLYSLQKPIKAGYNFDGWYNNEELMVDGIWETTEDITLIAKWSIINYSINYNVNEGVNSITNPINYTVEDDIVLDDAIYYSYTTNNGTYYKNTAIFLGWYKDVQLTSLVTKINKGSTGDIILYAKFSDETSSKIVDLIEYVSNGGLVPIRVDENNNYSKDGNYMLYGVYPQTKVEDDTLCSILTTKSGILPTATDSSKWTSYKYYGGSTNETDYMWYIDVEESGAMYRGVYFNLYRPNYTNLLTKKENSNQIKNDYFIYNIYWFKYEPIRWQILEDSENDLTLYSELIIDSQEFNHSSDIRIVDNNEIYPNNYKYSSIREWLNNDFYYDAFKTYQESNILSVLVNNTASTTENNLNPYICDNTNDKIWLLSYQEVNNSEFGFVDDETREKKATDYAKCMGIFDYVNSFWWLRSPSINKDSTDSLYIDYNGNLSFYPVNFTSSGVVPVIKVKK